MRDQMNNVNPIQVLAPVAARTDNTALVGNIVDRRAPVGNNSGNIFISAVAVLGYPHVAPTANPPA